MNSKLICLFLSLCLVLAACSNDESKAEFGFKSQNTEGELERQNAESGNEVNEVNEVNDKNVSKSPQGYIAIGSTAPIEYVQHNTEKVYQAGFVMEDGSLEWITFDGDRNLEKVIVSDEVKEPYLKRVEDKKDRYSFDESALSDWYIIYIPKNYPLQGGKVAVGTTHYGNTTRTVYGQSTMLYP